MTNDNQRRPAEPAAPAREDEQLQAALKQLREEPVPELLVQTDPDALDKVSDACELVGRLAARDWAVERTRERRQAEQQAAYEQVVAMEAAAFEDQLNRYAQAEGWDGNEVADAVEDYRNQRCRVHQDAINDAEREALGVTSDSLIAILPDIRSPLQAKYDPEYEQRHGSTGYL